MRIADTARRNVKIMIVVYRREKNESEWHRHTQCPKWPEVNYVQTVVLPDDEIQRVCRVCLELEAAMFPEARIARR